MLPRRRHLLARTTSSALLGLASLAGVAATAAPASAAPTTINCDTAAQPSASWTTCQKLTATASCVFNNNNGSWTMALGYTNPTGDILTAAIPNGGNGGANNAVTATGGSAANPSHISTFEPGDSTTAFTVSWTPTSKTDPVSWTLMGHAYTFTDTITACTVKPVTVVEDATFGGLAVALILGAALGFRRRVRPLRIKGSVAV